MNRSEIAKYLEHTQLNPAADYSAYEKLVKEAQENNFFGICVPPFWVKKVKRDLSKTDIKVVTVIGFPLGYQMSEVKIEEMKLAIRDGVDELDMVMNISAFKAGLPWHKIDIAKCTSLAHKHEKVLKVIIETALLSEEEIVKACHICADAGADYVKTSTGFSSSGAKVEDIKLMRANLPEHVGIKASGGIKTFEFAEALIAAGADRIGTSSGGAILQEATAS